jgi:hypothetical protein
VSHFEASPPNSPPAATVTILPPLPPVRNAAVRNYKRETLGHCERITSYIVVEGLEAAVVRSSVDDTIGSKMDNLSAISIEVRCSPICSLLALLAPRSRTGKAAQRRPCRLESRTKVTRSYWFSFLDCFESKSQNWNCPARRTRRISNVLKAGIPSPPFRTFSGCSRVKLLFTANECRHSEARRETNPVK